MQLCLVAYSLANSVCTRLQTRPSASSHVKILDKNKHHVTGIQIHTRTYFQFLGCSYQFGVKSDSPRAACKLVCQFNYTGLLGLADSNPLCTDTKVSCFPFFSFHALLPVQTAMLKSLELWGLRVQRGANAPCCIMGFTCTRWNSFPKGNRPSPQMLCWLPTFCSQGANNIILHRAVCVPYREQVSAHAVWCGKSGSLPEVSADNQKIYGAAV